jgi:hypothetical protein
VGIPVGLIMTATRPLPHARPLARHPPSAADDSPPWCNTDRVTNREDLHRLLDAVPETRLPALKEILLANLAEPEPPTPRQFTSTGTLSTEHDLAERSGDILRRDSTGG